MSEMKTAVGVISGTSMDGIDVAMLRSDGEERVEAGIGFSVDYSRDLARELHAVAADPARAEGELAELEREVTDAHVAAVEKFLGKCGTPRAAIDCVGFHGQTVLHAPERSLTRQLFDGARAARQLGMDVVCDFRSADMRAGGQGAPFAPVYHAAIAASLDRPLMVLNWGGVGNVTYLGPDGAIVAFDTGPANALIDDFVRARRGASHDANGALAASGTVNRRLLETWLQDAYFGRPAPKSLDRNHFRSLTAGVDDLSDADGAATLTAFTVEATAAALQVTGAEPSLWLVTGGGRKNGALMAGLEQRLGVPVRSIEAIGYDGDQLEAQLFGYLAIRSRRGLPLSFPTTTGVKSPLTGGVYWPKG